MQDYFKELDTAQYQASFTLTENDGGGTVVLNVEADNGTRLYITQINLKMSVVSSARQIYGYLQDSSGVIISTLMYDTTAYSSTYLTFPNTGSIATNTANVTSAHYIPVINGDQLQFQGISLSDGESITVLIRGYIRGGLPVTSTTGSSNTPSLTTTYQRIV